MRATAGLRPFILRRWVLPAPGLEPMILLAQRLEVPELVCAAERQRDDVVHVLARLTTLPAAGLFGQHRSANGCPVAAVAALGCAGSGQVTLLLTLLSMGNAVAAPLCQNKAARLDSDSVRH